MADAINAVRELGTWAAEVTAADVPEHVWERLELVLLDHLGVTLAGARTPEGRALAATLSEDGPAPVLGTRRSVPIDVAAWTNATLACSLELDEGNKHARGHPAIHVFPAVLAAAAASDVSGQGLREALLVGYEVAARAGLATVLHRGLHPHGSWGALGAAAGIAHLRGLNGDATAAALDAAAGMVLAVPFASAIEGNLVRNAWVGHANQAGLSAARLAAAGWATAGRTADHTLGRILGELDPELLRSGLGERWCVTEGYFKRHACCSFTHPPIDAVLEFLDNDPTLRDRIERVEVATHRLAAGLDAETADNRLAAMFSIPVSLALAIRHGDAAPARFHPARLNEPALLDLASRIDVIEDPVLTARLPAERGARVTIRTTDGAEHVREVPNPIGDADHHPFLRADLDAKLAALLTTDELGRLRAALDELPAADHAAEVLRRLP